MYICRRNFAEEFLKRHERNSRTNQYVRRYVYYANNNISDTPNAISEMGRYLLYDSVANGARNEILGETTVWPCQILSDSPVLSIFCKKTATLYTSRRTKIMGIEAESRRLLIDRSSLIFCQIGRITVRRLNESCPGDFRWHLFTVQKRHFPSLSAVCKIRHYINPSQDRKLQRFTKNN